MSQSFRGNDSPMPRTGRPPELGKVVDQDPDTGLDITAADKIIECITSVWMPWESAAAYADLDPATLKRWKKRGGHHRARRARGETLTERENDYADFCARIERAEAEAERRYLAVIDLEAAGGYTLRKTTTRTFADGKTETTVVEEQARPTWTAAAWKLERRKPAQYGRIDRLQMLEHDADLNAEAQGMSTEERTAKLGESLTAYLAGVKDGAAVSGAAEPASVVVSSAAEPTDRG